MKRIGLLRSITVLCVATFLATPVLLVNVDAAVSLRVTPAILSLEAETGATGQQSITLANDGDVAVEIMTGVEPYQGASGEYSAVDWLQVEPATFTLEAGESRDAIISIEVPDGLTSGGRYALVTFATSAAGETSEGSGASVAAKLGAAILLVVKGNGDLTEAAELLNFGPVLEPDGRVGFQALVLNTGNVHLRPSGGLEIKDESGAEYGSLEIPEERTVLPGNEAILTARGSLPIDQSASYSVTAEIQYGDDRTLTGEVSFVPTVHLSMAPVNVCENLDRGPTLSATIQNNGGLGLSPIVRFVVHSANGNLIGDASAQPPSPIWGGTPGEIVAEFSERLVTGDYLLTTHLLPVQPAANGEPIVPPTEYEQPFSIGGLGGNAAPLCEALDNS